MLKIISVLMLLNALILLIAWWRFRKSNESVNYDYSDNKNIDRIFMDELKKQNQELRFAVWDILKKFDNGDEVRRNSLGRIYVFRKKKTGGWLVKPIEDFKDLYAKYINHFLSSSVLS